MTTAVECPHCGQRVPWTDRSRWRPFCSERCRLIDLGLWFDEKHAIAGDPVIPFDGTAQDSGEQPD